MADEFLDQRTPDATLDGAFAYAEVARVFLEDCGVKKVAEESGGSFIRPGRSEALAVTLRALPVAGEAVVGLADAGLDPGNHDGGRVDRSTPKHPELLDGPQRRGVVLVGDA